MGALIVRTGSAILALLVTCVLSACSPDDAPAPKGSTTLQPAVGSKPAGTTRVSCDLDAASGPVRLALDLPDDFTKGRRACTWRMRVRMHDSDIPYSIDVVVEARSVDDSLDDVYALEKINAVDGDTPEDDDSILDLVLEQDVPALGRTLGDRLSWRCYCDGQDLITRMTQADGIRVTWSSVVSLTKETDAAFDRAVEGAGTV